MELRRILCRGVMHGVSCGVAASGVLSTSAPPGDLLALRRFLADLLLLLLLLLDLLPLLIRRLPTDLLLLLLLLRLFFRSWSSSFPLFEIDRFRRMAGPAVFIALS